MIYDHFDADARRKFGGPLCPEGYDLHLLRQFRRYKENLSFSEQPPPLSWMWLAKRRRLVFPLNRTTFEQLIQPHVDSTLQLPHKLRDEAQRFGPPDTLVPVGGSSRIPLIHRQITEQLAIQPLKWQKQDLAVALGAAYMAQRQWGSAGKSVVAVSVPAPPRPAGRASFPETGVRVLENSGTRDFATLAEAGKQAAEGATLLRAPGEHRLREPLIIEKSLTLLRPGAERCRVTCDGEGWVLVFSGDGPWRVEGIRFEHLGSVWAHVLVVANGSITLKGCVCRGAVWDGPRRARAASSTPCWGPTWPK